jgi:predicted RNase H-like HicB family nuclease
MSQEFSVIVEKDSDGYFVASVPSIPGCHTQAKSLDELMERIHEAIELCIEFDTSYKDSSLEFIGIQKVTVQV